MIPSICTKMAVSRPDVWPIDVDLLLVRYIYLLRNYLLDSKVCTDETICVV